jgi:hypothetical protein
MPLLKTLKLTSANDMIAVSRFFQTPPDLVVKSQAIDIIAAILRLVLRLRVMYQREIKG